MARLQLGFGRDIILLTVVTILLGSLAAAGAGYLSDLYFGELAAQFIGGTGRQDIMLIVKEPQREAAYKKIKQIIADKLPGAEVTSGVKILGRVNFFIQLRSRHKTRATFLELDNYFESVPGVESFSLITEPRVTIRGLKPEIRTWLEPKLNSQPGVRFTVPDGDKLEIIITQSNQLTSVKQAVEKLLAKYQVLSVKFPLNVRPDNLFALAEQLVSQIQRTTDYSIYNVTGTTRRDLGKLITTMREMKKFLQSYASHVKVKVRSGKKLELEDRLVVPGLNGEQIILRVIEVNNQQVNTLIVEGDSRQIIGNQAYRLKQGQLGAKVGAITVDNPRQQLAYVINQLTTVLPAAEASLQQGQKIINQLKTRLKLVDSLQPTVTELKVAHRQLVVYQQKLEQVKLDHFRRAVTEVNTSLQQIIEIANKLQFIRTLLTKLSRQLSQTAGQLKAVSRELTDENPYQQEVNRLADTLKQLAAKIDQNIAPIITYINRYNPLLARITAWQQQIKQINAVLTQVEDIDRRQLKSLLAAATNQSLLTDIEQLTSGQVVTRLSNFKDKLQLLGNIEVKPVIKELQFVERALPQLKDEEITASIDLIDEYIAGKVIPGREISLLAPTKEVDWPKLKQRIQRFFPQSVSFSRFQPGIIEPSFRTQLYEILTEVRMILAAAVAVIWTIFSLLLDQTIIIISLRLLGREINQWLKVLGDIYGTAVGSILLASIFKLARIDLPHIPFWLVVVVGGGLGWAAARNAARLNDISPAEFEVGRALGFTYPEIMRQIIIPAGKPGLLRLLNRTQSYF